MSVDSVSILFIRRDLRCMLNGYPGVEMIFASMGMGDDDKQLTDGFRLHMG